MPVAMIERVKSRRSQVSIDSAGGSIDRNFFVLGTDNDLAVRALVESSTPAIYGGMFFHFYTIEPVGRSMWDVSVKYFSSLPKSATSTAFSFDTTGGTAHVNVSRDTAERVSFTTEEAPDFQGCIGVNGDSVEGADVIVPQYSFSITAYLPQAIVTPTYRNVLFNLTGSTNNGPWGGFDTEEVLFAGAQGSTRGLDLWEITFKFLASPNKIGVNAVRIGRANKKIDKLGWHYLWVRYADKLDGNARALVRVPVAAYTEQVYEPKDFTLLGLGS